MPIRPDFNDAISAQGEKEERVGGQNSWVIDTLVRDDVIVVDLFGKVKDGTFAGDNLGNSIYAKTRTGMVIDGGIRDLDGIYELPDFATFVRGVDPTGIANVTLTGINIPIRIAEATVSTGRCGFRQTRRYYLYPAAVRTAGGRTRRRGRPPRPIWTSTAAGRSLHAG